MGKLLTAAIAAVAAIVLLTAGSMLIIYRVTEPATPGSRSTAREAAPATPPPAYPPEPFRGDPAAGGWTAEGTPGGPVQTQAPAGQGAAAVAPPTESDESEDPPASNRRRTRVPKLDRSARGKHPEE